MPRNRDYHAQSRITDNPDTCVCELEDVSGLGRLSKRHMARARLHKFLSDRRDIPVIEDRRHATRKRRDLINRTAVQDKSRKRIIVNSDKAPNNPKIQIPFCPIKSPCNPSSTNNVERPKESSAGTKSLTSGHNSSQLNKDRETTSDTDPRPRKPMLWVKDKGWVRSHEVEQQLKQRKITYVRVWVEGKGWHKILQAKPSPAQESRDSGPVLPIKYEEVKKNSSNDKLFESTHVKDKCVGSPPDQESRDNDPALHIKHGEAEKNSSNDKLFVNIWVKGKGWTRIRKSEQSRCSRYCCQENNDNDSILPIDSTSINDNGSILPVDTTSINDNGSILHVDTTSINKNLIETIVSSQKIVYRPSETASPKKAIKSLTRLRDLLLVTMEVDYPLLRHKRVLDKNTNNSTQTLNKSAKTNNLLDDIPNQVFSVGLYRKSMN